MELASESQPSFYKNIHKMRWDWSFTSCVETDPLNREVRKKDMKIFRGSYFKSWATGAEIFLKETFIRIWKYIIFFASISQRKLGSWRSFNC